MPKARANQPPATSSRPSSGRKRTARRAPMAQPSGSAISRAAVQPARARPGCSDCAMPASDVPRPTRGRMASRAGGRMRGCRQYQPSHSTNSMSGQTHSGVFTTIWKTEGMAHHRRRHRPEPSRLRGKAGVFRELPGSSFTMRETPYLRSIPYQLPWVLGVAIVMAVTGPFGLYDTASLGVRLVYFGATGVLIWLQVLGFALLLAQ